MSQIRPYPTLQSRPGSRASDERVATSKAQPKARHEPNPAHTGSLNPPASKNQASSKGNRRPAPQRSAWAQHADWIRLLEVSGPFLELPALTALFPQGLPTVDATLRADLRARYEEWGESMADDRAIHTLWIRSVLRNVLLRARQHVPRPQPRGREDGGALARST